MLSSHVVRPSPEKTSGGWWGAIRLKVAGSELTFQRVGRELGSHRRNGDSRLDGCDKGAQIEEAGTVGRVVRVVSRVGVGDCQVEGYDRGGETLQFPRLRVTDNQTLLKLV